MIAFREGLFYPALIALLMVHAVWDQHFLTSACWFPLIQGHSTQLSDVVKLFLFAGEKQHIKLGIKWKLVSECLFCYFQFYTHIKVLGKTCLTNDLYDEK